MEVVIRRSRVLWLEEVKSDCKFKERSRWKIGLTKLSFWKRKFYSRYTILNFIYYGLMKLIGLK